MAIISASLFTALDGSVDPGVGNWHFPYFNEEMGEAVTGTHEADVMLFGRVTYDSFAGAWPAREAAGEADAVMAKHLGDVRKIVASRGSLDLTWRNSEQLEGDLVDAVTAAVTRSTTTSASYSSRRICGADRVGVASVRSRHSWRSVGRTSGRRRARTSTAFGSRSGTIAQFKTTPLGIEIRSSPRASV